MSGRDRSSAAKAKWTPSLLEVCVLALIMAASGWGLHALGNAIEDHLTGRREDTIANLLQTLDYDISYRDISPSLLRAFEIRDLAISSREASDSPLVFIRHLRLRYSLSRLVTSRDPVAALREIQLVDSDFALDLEGDQGLAILLQALSAAVSGAAGASVPGALPPLHLAGANLGVVIEGPRHPRGIARTLLSRACRRSATDHGERQRGWPAVLDGQSGTDRQRIPGNRLPSHRQRRGRLQLGRRDGTRAGVDDLLVRHRAAHPCR